MLLDSACNVPVNAKTAHTSGQPPGHLTRVKLRTVGNLTQNDARPVGHLTFLSKRLSAVVSRVQRSLLSSIPRGLFCYILYSYIVISQNMPFVKVWSDDKVNKKFIVAENFTQLVAKGKRWSLLCPQFCWSI